jgi:hypothetical protein
VDVIAGHPRDDCFIEIRVTADIVACTFDPKIALDRNPGTGRMKGERSGGEQVTTARDHKSCMMRTSAASCSA